MSRAAVNVYHYYLLLDTADPFDAAITGRDGPESHTDGQGLKVSFDGTGTIPSITLNGPDGEIELVGIAEIRAATGALKSGLKLAEAFGDPIPLHEWRKRNR